MLEYELEIKLFRYDADGDEDRVFRTIKSVKSDESLFEPMEKAALDMNDAKDKYEEELQAKCEHEFAAQDLVGDWHCPDCDRIWSETPDPSDLRKETGNV